MSRKSKVKKGDLVGWEGKTCRVVKRRAVTGLAMFKTADFEVCLEVLDGKYLGWVGENEVTKLSGEASEA